MKGAPANIAPKEETAHDEVGELDGAQMVKAVKPREGSVAWL